MESTTIEDKTTVTESKNMKPCPFCAEDILAAAIKCKHCGEMLETAQTTVKSPAPPTSMTSNQAPQVSTKPSPTYCRNASIGLLGLTKVSGKVTTLGKGTWHEAGRKSANERYSIIEINGLKFKDVFVDDHLGTYLDRALNNEAELILFRSITKNYLVAIKTDRGFEKYHWPLLVSTVLSGVFSIYLIGLPFLAVNLYRCYVVSSFRE